MLDKYILSGHENGRTKKELKTLANIEDDEKFYEELNNLREKCIILVDKSQGTYYRPSTEQEYLDFIEKNHKVSYKVGSMIMIAYKELENLKK